MFFCPEGCARSRMMSRTKLYLCCCHQYLEACTGRCAAKVGSNHLIHLLPIQSVHRLINDDKAALCRARSATVRAQPGREGVRHKLTQQALQQ